MQAPSFLQRDRSHNQRSEAKEDPLDNAHWERRVAESGRCSALVRLTDGNDDLYMGHTTWDDYSKMTRIFKYYNFVLPGADSVASLIAFSSYPGVLSSTDDFYTTDSKLVVMETSLMVLDPALWDRAMHFPEHPHIPNFVHIMATNRMARSAQHWSWLFSGAKTGTYASQWMVVDYNKLEEQSRGVLASSALPANTFWVVEVLPGVVESRDMTAFLARHDALRREVDMLGEEEAAAGAGDGIDYLVGCQYCPATQRLYLVAGEHCGTLHLLAVEKEVVVALASLRGGGGGAARGHTSDVRCFLWDGGGLLSGGEDARLCSWSPDTDAAAGSDATPLASTSRKSAKPPAARAGGARAGRA